MSSQLSESTRLLDDSGLAESRSTGSRSRETSLSRERFWLTPQSRFIPVILGAELACQLPTTTFIELVRLAVCQISRGSTSIPVVFLEGPSAIRCDAPDVAQYFAIVISVLGVIDGLTCATAYGLLNHISSRSGRKSALLLLLATAVTGCCLIAGSQFAPGWLAGWVFFVGVIFRMLSGSLPLGYLASLYITDTCTAEDRTAALSKTGGWATLGVSISLFLGGLVTTKTENPLIVFYMAALVFAVVFVYVLMFLPESFSEEKREALKQLQLENSHGFFSRATRISLALRILRPLKSLAPSRKLDGTRSWRLAWCAIHNFIYATANSYMLPGWMVLVTSAYHLTPAETGLFFSIATISSSIVMIVIVPSLVRLLRPFYVRKTMDPLADEENTREAGNLDYGTSDHLNVHLAFVACVISAICYLCAAASTTSTGAIISAIFIGFTIMRGPAVSSLVAGSVDPLKQGEALAAFQMVASTGGVLSPIIMGSILTATISSAPLFLFHVHLVVVLFSGSLLFFIRDTDGYQKPYEA